jgi:hypothetical protein
VVPDWHLVAQLLRLRLIAQVEKCDRLLDSHPTGAIAPKLWGWIPGGAARCIWI